MFSCEIYKIFKNTYLYWTSDGCFSKNCFEISHCTINFKLLNSKKLARNGFDSVDFTFFFLLFDLPYSGQFYLLICFLLQLLFVSFLFTITVKVKIVKLYVTFDFYYSLF